MKMLRFISFILFIPLFLAAQYTGGSGDGFAVWTSVDDISLPVELLSHSEHITTEGIMLKWETGSEVGNLGFIIKRSRNEQPFSIVGNYQTQQELRGLGNSSSGKKYMFTDKLVSSGGSYKYQVVSVSISGTKETVFKTKQLIFSQSGLTDILEGFEVSHNYPNPFNPETKIIFRNGERLHVSVSIYTLLGELVVLLADRNFDAGTHELLFKPNHLNASQVFICEVKSKRFVKYFKMMFTK